MAGNLVGDPNTIQPQGEAKDHFEVDWGLAPIDRLAPGSEHHNFVFGYIMDRIRSSEREMTRFHSRWRMAERRCQAYMHLTDYEAMLKEMNDKGVAPTPAKITVPYMFATMSTVTTYLGKVFCGRKPILQIAASKGTDSDKVRRMETVLQYNADYTKLVARLFQFFLDGETYGLGVMRCTWKREWGRRTVWTPPSRVQTTLNPNAPPQRSYVDRITFEGNEVENIDPFLFFPDPNVPMCEVNSKGEFVAWRDYVGQHKLLSAEKLGQVKYVSGIKPEDCTYSSKSFNLSSRNLISHGRANAGERQKFTSLHNAFQVDQGCFEIIPSALGLGESNYPEKWLFTIIGERQIIQAEPLDLDHGKHPVEVAEPYTLGYGFGQPGLSDYIAPIQDLMSWLINSHIENVRAALNNMFVVDPSKIEMQDFLTPGAGKRLRLKPTAMGTDVRTAIQQLQVTDVTQNHLNNLPLFLRIGDSIAAVNDRARGTEGNSNRSTATEERLTVEGGLARMGKHAQTYSTQAIVGLAQQMVMNLQQKISQDLYLEIVGNPGGQFYSIAPQDLAGDFNYPVHDGTMPMDRAAMQQTWVQILQLVQADPELRQKFPLDKIFEFLAELSGAINISQFRNPALPPGQAIAPPTLAPDAQVQQQAQLGNMVPVGQA